jgi:hypothetical protein
VLWSLGGTTPAAFGRVARFEISDYRAIKFKKFNSCPNNRNNGSKLVPLIGGAKGNGKTAKTRPPCAPNSVDICFGCISKVKIDHMAKASNIDTASGNIGCD